MKLFVLLAAALLAAANANAGVLESTSPSGLCDSVKQLSGYFKLEKQSKNYFYWFFEARNDPATAPLVLWLTGGPGCSSEVALFGENGPCKVQTDLSTKTNPNSWNKNANLLYVDQPAGTGFSYGSHDTNEKEVGEDMYEFLQAFIQANPQYTKTQEFYVFGESYAGHYVPAVTHRIFLGNKKLAPGMVHIPLKGLAIGNGLTDPEIQYSKYPDMACNSGTAPHVPGFSNPDSGLCAAMKKAVPGCVESITKCNQGHTLSCVSAYMKCNTELVTPVELSGINLYDLREKCQHPPLCYDFSLVDKYLQQDSVKAALGVKGHSWSSCNHLVTIGFLGDWMKDYQTELPDMLAAGIDVLIYAGDQDYICNWIGNKAWTLALPWTGKDAFNKAEDKSWKVDGVAAGKARTVDNFTFLQVFQAGHMVPRDQPVNALAMIETFISGKSFSPSQPTTVVSMNPNSISPRMGSPSAAGVAKDAVEVVEGIAEGLLIANGADIASCAGDAANTLADLKRAASDFKIAFTVKKTKASVETAFVAVSDVAADFLHAAMDCGAAGKKVFAEVEAVVKRLKAPGGWVKVLEGEALTIFKDRHELTSDCKAIYAAFEAGQFNAVGRSIGKIISILLEPSSALYAAVPASVQVQQLNAIENMTWVASENKSDFFEGMTEADIKGVMGAIITDDDDETPVMTYDTSSSSSSLRGGSSSSSSSDIPDSFDARTAWPKNIHPIRNQEKCGSCWAFSASEVLSDRFSIASKGADDAVLSPEDMVSCDKTNMGCRGGQLPAAWEYLQTEGIVTDTCFPYDAGAGTAGQCETACEDNEPFTKYKAKSYYQLKTVSDIQKDIMANGPVQAAFRVYKSFMSYQTGVYQRSWWKIWDTLEGGHAIKIVGWGVDNEVPYWTVANSWAASWGEDGYFRIKRGVNECGIEGNVYAGIPAL